MRGGRVFIHTPEIEAMRAEGWSLYRMARHIGVTAGAISMHLKRVGREDLRGRVPRSKTVGPCAICSRTAPLIADHCHQTGRARGLLCRACNIGLGVFRDSPEVLGKAIAYLQGFRQ
jgi:hypothetical protein